MRAAEGEVQMTREMWALNQGKYVPDKHPGQGAQRVLEDTATSPAKAPPQRLSVQPDQVMYRPLNKLRY